MRDVARLAPRIPSRLAAPLAALLLAACDRAPATAAGGDLRFERSQGNGQRWVLGERLPTELSVRVFHGDRSAAPGVRVRFRVTAGGGAVSPAEAVTDVAGFASAAWTLGRADAGGQTVVATADDVPGATATFTARGVDPATVDVLEARGVEDRPARMVVTSRETFTGAGAFVTEVTGAARLVPFEEPAAFDQVVAFAAGRPPVLLAPVAWTPRADALVASFRAPHRMPLTVWIVHGPFAATEAVAREHLAAMQATYRASALGVEFDARIVDATRFAAEFPPDGTEHQCDGLVPERVGKAPGQINVYYVPLVGVYEGYQCGVDWVLMAPTSARTSGLLAHEIGHTFALGHEAWTTANVMNARSPGGSLSLGQLFRAHFDARSSLNAVYRLRPEAEVRECQGAAGIRAAPCLPATFDR